MELTVCDVFNFEIGEYVHPHFEAKKKRLTRIGGYYHTVICFRITIDMKLSNYPQRIIDKLPCRDIALQQGFHVIFHDVMPLTLSHHTTNSDFGFAVAGRT